ncbi:hypothetical protein F4810DRAFT_718537 [Camillea tinctor]|nr:hypothetical protein F4810DRAFT_718537 [Camillea tinctor]
MAAVFHASPNDLSDDEVTVILSPRNTLPTSVSQPERRLVLTRKAPAVRIGRASKVPTKGFVAAPENAWFDSPVMSRQHAELFANFDANPKTVSIKDAGSLHGTFHTPNDGANKETRLEPQRPIKLTNGDILRFGIDIFRSKETFPPCSVDFLMEVKTPQHQSSKGTFSVPDDIDEDEVDYLSEMSESDMVFEVSPDGKMLAPPFNPTMVPRRGFSIDLTREDTQPSSLPHPNSSMTLHAKSDFIDLTSEPDNDSDHELDAPVSSFNPISQPVPSALPVKIDSINIPQADHGFDTDYSSERGEVGFRVDYDDDDDDDDDESDAENTSGHSSLENESQDSVSEANDTDQHESGSEIDDDHDMDAFEEDSMSACIFLARLLPANQRTGLLDLHKASYYEDSDSSSIVDDADNTMLDILSPKVAPQPRSPRGSPGPIGPFASTSFSAASVASSIPQARQPSPSDAAMFKSRPVLNQAPNESRAQALGEMTGKFEYFAARENNRAVVSFHETPVPVSAIRETLQSEPEVSRPAQNDIMDTEEPQPANNLAAPDASLRQPTPEAQETTDTVNLRASSTTQDSAWSVSGERFINNPNTNELPPLSTDRAQSPDLDMTSAYTFQQSKLATEAKARQNIRRLPIQDLLLAHEPEEASLRPNYELPDAPEVYDILGSPIGIKRSFGEAFDNDEDDNVQLDPNVAQRGCSIHLEGELRDSSTGMSPQPLSSSHSPQNDELEQEPAHQDAMLDGNSSEEEIQSPVIVPIQETCARPSKRLRLARAAAYVSCAALGGAAAFSVLVSTAPF